MRMNTTATGGRTTSSGTGALLVIAAVCATVFAIFAPTIMPSRANAAEVTYTTWRQVADAIAAQLNQGEQKYADGNTAGASSDFMAAYNTIYVGSNFTTVVHDTLGTDRQADHQRQFQTITSLSYTTGNSAQIAQQVVALNTDLHTAATTLDANTSLDKPDVYARKLAAQIKADRKRLDAAKTKNNGKGARTWSEVAKEMGDILDKALAAYEHGDGAKGAGYVNDAYYQYYEKLGFEKNVMNAISGGRVSQVEYQFKESRQAMNNGEPIKQASQYVTDLKAMLVEDAATLDGGAAGKVNPFTAFVTSAFGQAFIILLRRIGSDPCGGGNHRLPHQNRQQVDDPVYLLRCRRRPRSKRHPGNRIQRAVRRLRPPTGNHRRRGRTDCHAHAAVHEQLDAVTLLRTRLERVYQRQNRCGSIQRQPSVTGNVELPRGIP